MDINRGTLNNLFTGYKTVFMDALKMAPDTWSKFAMTIPSETAINSYPFLEQFGGMREWIGDRQIKNLASKKFDVKNRDFEDTVSVLKNDIEDDQIGLYTSLIAQMGLNAGKIWQDLAVEALIGGVSSLWVDDKTFFATDRKYGKSTINNKGTGALTSTTFGTAYTAMMGYCGHTGRALGVVPDTLIVGPKLREAAWNILKNDFYYDSTDKVQIKNHNQGLCELFIMNELVGNYDDYWFLAQTKGILKPIAVQQRKQPILVRLDNETDENVFMRKELIYGTDARGSSFATMPHLIYGGIVA